MYSRIDFIKRKGMATAETSMHKKIK